MRKEKTTIFILIILVLGLLTAIGLHVFDVMQIFPCPVCMDNCQQTRVEEKETKLYDGRLISKTAMLLTGGTSWYNSLPSDSYLKTLFKDLKVDKEEIAYKLLINSETATYDTSKVTNQSIIDLYGLDSIKEYPPEFVSENGYKYAYELLFGNQNAPMNEKFDGCPSARYNSNLKGYLLVHECGNLSMESFLVYISNVYEYGKYSTVNIKVGYSKIVPEEDNTWELFNDVNETKSLGKIINNNLESISYDDLSEYKITFEKKTTDTKPDYVDYYFNKIERVK